MRIGILFDLDGTLLDTLQDLTDATNVTMRHYDRPEKTAAEMRYIIGSGARYQITTALDQGAEGLDMDEVLRFYRAYYDVHACVKTCPYPYVVDALAALKEKYPVGIVSNKPDEVVQELSARFFPGTYALGQCPERPTKPAPDMVKKAMTDLRMDACVYVGDTEIDVQTAKNANAPCLCVLWGFRDREQLDAAGGKYYCNDGKQLVRIIEKLVGETYGE